MLSHASAWQATDGLSGGSREPARAMFTVDGKFVKQLIRTGTTFARNLALSADPGSSSCMWRRKDCGR